MLRVSKCALYFASFNVRSMCRVTKQHLSKSNKIKTLMKQYKTMFGKLVETNAQKKKRLKLEMKGKIPRQQSNTIDTELQWIMKRSSGNLKKIASTHVQSRSNYKDAVENTKSNQDHTNDSRSSITNQTKSEEPSKNFERVIPKIKKPAEENIKNACYTEHSQTDQNMQSNVACPTYDLSDALDVKNKAAEYDISSDLIKPPDIITKKLSSFPIVGSKQDSSVEFTKVLSIAAKDNLKTTKFPSVTKILSQTMPLSSRQALEAWKERMIQKLGQEGFDIYQKELMEDGASLHSCIAQSLLGNEYEVPSRIEPVFKSVQCALGDLSHVKAVETHVAHTDLRYSGIVDCIASYRGKTYVIDWKKSDRKKLGLKQTYDAPVQLAAYIGAINASNLYPFVIKYGLLVVAYTCGSPATVHEVCDNTLQQYWIAWLRRLRKYYVQTTSNDDNKTVTRQ